MQPAYTITLVEIFVIISYLRTFREITELFIRKLPDTYTSSLACCMFEIFVIISYLRTLGKLSIDGQHSYTTINY
jgi:hypothetical protein